MSYFHCGNGYPDRCNGYRGPLDTYVCTNPRHDEDHRHDCEHTSMQHGADGCNVPGCLCAFMSWNES